jgi:glycosyltransferase involved in cell wall biosynthesis
MRVHFVYTIPALSTVSRLKQNAVLLAYKCGVEGGWFRQRTGFRTDDWPSYSPASVTKHVYETLRANFQTNLYDWQERMLIRGGDNDVLIGHPNPMDSRSVWNQSCVRGRFGVRIAMFPIHHGLAEINAPIEQYIPQVDAIFGITGEYWYDTWDKSAFAHWKPKIVRLDMAIDTAYFPRVKTRFNRKGKRKFFFIGNAQPGKGVHLLSILFGLARNHQCVWIGGPGGFPNLHIRNGFVLLTPDYMERIAEECDFFITMGVSDANPTTILEAMAWGFPVCCTPQSGYYNLPGISELSTTDMGRNIEVLDQLQETPEEELIARADAARRLVETNYTWDRFNDVVLTELKAVAARKGLL